MRHVADSLSYLKRFDLAYRSGLNLIKPDSPGYVMDIPKGDTVMIGKVEVKGEQRVTISMITDDSPEAALAVLGDNMWSVLCEYCWGAQLDQGEPCLFCNGRGWVRYTVTVEDKVGEDEQETENSC